MKISFFFFFFFFAISLNGQETPSKETQDGPDKSNSKKVLRSKKKWKDRKIYVQPSRNEGGTTKWKLRASNQVISPAPVSHNKLNGLKERALFKAKSNYHIALMDLEAYYFNKKKKPVKILSGEKVEILKKGTWDYKLKYNDQKLFVKRQHYFPSLEQE